MIDKIVCKSCGSLKIFTEAYINVNTGKPEDEPIYLKRKSLTSIVWCSDCQAMTNPIEEDEYLAISEEKAIPSDYDN